MITERREAARTALADLRAKLRLLQEVVDDHADIEVETGLIWPEISGLNHVSELLHEALVFMNKEEETCIR